MEKNVAVVKSKEPRARRARAKAAPQTQEQIQHMWARFKATGDPELRNRLIEKYLPLVRYIAERVLAKLPQNIELDDLTSAGIFGLMDAVNGFDLARGVKFETYCTTRIRGAILDELRSLDWVPRIVRNKAHRIDHAKTDLEGRLGRPPSDLEMREALGVSAEEFEGLIADSQPRSMSSLNDKVRDDQSRGDGSRMSMLPDQNAVDPEEELRKKEVTEFMLKGVSRKERLILLLYYYEDLTMREIGAALNLSESRVCQLHSRIISRLKTQLKKHQTELLS
ncbi:MAG TPA: FliA/WhiG family RNA polymerase sigma factor [Planctomycetota bacterium]|nr:FliA/WhiG family RNA polymerase sigma factor [Planctomycetota bacterium]HNU26960.1 FliA/WhiG family RNA polymerase sigma factor [Planctomycetota bacterium]HOE29858.1 FliA/WhiG family RNA polymerase sigma factor [Planctomycetota bacterium]HOE86903.1 FliA/WhiG family RNA polymerase sigma factor [Planctomycetota bacterium]HOR67482.1 FliA/WhiG family RNA polymerase sigma factor [Planctomycetota bacterium]